MSEKIKEWLLDYYQNNLIASVYPEANAIRRLLRVKLAEGENNKILIELPLGVKKVFIDFKTFPRVGKNVAVIGAGMIASAVHIPALVSIGANIKYIVDINEKKAARVAELCGAEPLKDIRFMDSKIDYAVICVPPEFHPDLAKRIMEMDSDCFVEKPIALTTRDARLMIEVAKKTGKKLLVGHMRHWDPQYEEIRDLAKTGNIRILRRCFQSAPLWRGKQCRDAILEDGAVHDLDLLRTWFGDPRKLRVITNKKDHIVIQLQFKNGEAEIDDEWIGTYTKLPLAVELLRQVMEKTFYNKIWEARTLKGERTYYYHERDRIPLVAYQAEHYELLTSPTGNDLRYKAEDALKTMELIEAIQKAPLNQWTEYRTT